VPTSIEPGLPVARFTATRGDLFKFYIYHYFHSWGFVAVQIVLLAFLSHSFYRALPPEAPAAAKVIVFGMFFLLGVASLAILFFAGIAVHVLARKNRTITTEHVIILAEDGLREETPFGTTERTWAAVQQLRRSKNYIFVYIAAHQAHLIPRRAFGTQEEWDRFYASCREKTQRK
jgi:YcxB-like protein